MSTRDDDQVGSTARPYEAELAEHRRTTIPAPPTEQTVYRADATDGVVGATRRTFDLPATIAGALAALGTLVLLSSLLGAVVGSIGYQTDVDDQDLSIGGLIAGLVVLFLACLVGGWVAGRIARHKGGLHGLVSVLWLVALAAILAALAAVAGDEYDVTERVGLPSWFDSDALAPAAIGTGLLALALALLGGWLGGRLGERHERDSGVALVETRHAVSERPGGINPGGAR
jgi:putative membrane protein (TIGR04086 family)